MGGSEPDRVVIAITIVDRLDLAVDGRRIGLASRKARALLGYLLLNGGATESREHLVGLLWSESDEEKARASLRQCIKEIRLSLRGSEFTGLQLEGQSIGFDPNSITVDLWSIIEQAKAGAVHPKLLDFPQITDALLKDVETVDPVFRTWLLAKRQSINQRLVRYLEDALQADAVEARSTEDVARAILNLDPTHEVACRQLMKARALRGDIGGALKIYTALWELLDKDYDVEPTEQTQALFAELKAALPLTGPPAAQPIERPVALSATTTRPTGTRLVLSIAPFDSAGVAPDKRYLVQGFRSELIAYLSRFREWMVREQPMGQARTNAADEYLLQSTTMPFRNGVRLGLSLRETSTDGYLWGDGLNLETVDWGEAQQRVVRRIAAALNIHVSAGRLAQIGPKSAGDLIAYDMWLRGQTQLSTLEPDGFEKADQLYRSIIAEHPTFAPAYSSLAQLHNAVHFVYPGRYRNPQTTAEALRFANEAVRLDPMDSRSQLCLGWANAMAGLHDQAAVHHKLAAELNDSDPWTLLSAAHGFALRTESDTARELADRAAALSLSPTGTQWRYQAMIRYLIDEFDECLAAAVEAEISIKNVLVWKAASLVRLGRVEEATEAADQFFGATADKWINESASPNRQQIARWFMHAFPFKHEYAWARLRDDFSLAGAPLAGLLFNIW